MNPILWTDKPLSMDSSDPPRPAREQAAWEQAVYPIGNGRLGCTAFGEPTRERIQFNHDSLWVGNEDSTGGYQPFGDIYVALGHDDDYDYRRELDISRAVQTITYRSSGVRYTREYFASYPRQLAVLRFSADQAASLSGTICMGNLHEIPVTAENDSLVMQGDTSNFWFWRLHHEQPERLIAGREYTSPKNIDLDFEARVRVLHDGGTVRAVGDSVVFENCDSLTLLLAADTNYLADRNKGWRGVHPHEGICARIEAAESCTYSELLDEHLADYQGLYNRMSIDLGETPPAVSACSTPERIEAYRAAVAQGGVIPDRDLEGLLYQFARYLMISSSRPGHGGLPANLQGIWLLNRHPAWRCDFHTDINVQMNYWFTSASNLCDCFRPLAEWVDSIREVRKEETRKVLGVKRGWLMRSENGIFGGSTWHFQKGDSAWLCQNLWDHYSFTQDKAYLERYAYPVMKEISEFWIDHLKELPRSADSTGSPQAGSGEAEGTLVAPDGRSPEHGPVGVDGVTYDQSLCWDLFTNTIEASEILGVDGDLREELSAKRARLLGPKIGRWGQLQEWMDDRDDPEDDHRHINHLIGVYPGRQIHPGITPELAEAAKVGLVARRDHGQGHPAWSRVWKACLFARLLDGESAYGQLAETLGTHIFGNLWAVHPPYQIDANFGYAAGVNELLVQSHLQADPHAYVIHLLPALPRQWPTGHVRGLRTRGGFEVDMEWRDGTLERAEIRNISSPDDHCVVRYGDASTTYRIEQGKTLLSSDLSALH